MRLIDKIRERARLFDLGLTAYDFNHQDRVFVTDLDGTLFNFVGAFYMREGCWYYVFTEHQGYHVFHCEEAYVHAYNMDI